MKTNQQILELNRRLQWAEETGQVDELEALLSENFAMVQADGVKISREEYLESVAGQPVRNRRIEQPDVHLYGQNAVYTCIATQMTDGNPTRYWNMRLFHYQDGQWLCTAWQVTKLCAPKLSEGLFNQVRFAYASGAK